MKLMSDHMPENQPEHALQANPCFECGQCCQRFRVSFYHGQLATNVAAGVPLAMVTQITPHLVCMKGTEPGKQACIALEFTNARGYRCAIYDQRPSPCREFDCYDAVGAVNPRCNALRIAVGLVPLLEIYPQ